MTGTWQIDIESGADRDVIKQALSDLGGFVTYGSEDQQGFTTTVSDGVADEMRKVAGVKKVWQLPDDFY
ncbi:hypothetical protein JCM10207_003467 [Rhodosporidiobolus poonsookiae]